MDARWLVPLLVLVALTGTASASHEPVSLPLLDEPPVQDALDWLEDERVTSEGCIHDAYDEECYVERTKWAVVSLGHTGVDPDAWPTPEASSMDWLRERADDLRDEELVDCQQEAAASQACADERVFSLAKAILAFEAAGEDPRSVEKPEGGERDLVRNLLDEHAETGFGRTDQVNDDVWALLALNDVGYEGSETENALDRIEQAQNADGGLGYEYDVGSSVDMTASAIMAVAPHDREAFLTDARAYLSEAQTDEGERRACWPLSSGDEPNTESTAWALQAVAALGEDPVEWSVDGQSPPECLSTFQSEEGAFRHADDSKLEFMPTHQALAALSWRPYGTLEGPTSRLQVTDQATAGEEHTAQIPGARLRIDDAGVEEHTWTPEQTGTRTFHGFALDPPRPASLVVEVEEAGSSGSQSGASASGSTASGSGGSSGSSSTDTGEPPQAHLEVPASAERNVSFPVHVNATPGDDTVTGFRLAPPGRAATNWQPAGSFEVRLDALGSQTLTAWARDAQGRVSEAVKAEVEFVDARPRIDVTGLQIVNRSTPVTFQAHANDPDGPTPNVTWTGPGDQQAEGHEATFRFEQPGTHTVEAQARDGRGNVANATWSLHARNRPPANLTLAPTQLEANTSQVLEADAEDPDGDPLEIAWRFPDDAEPTSWGGQLHLETGPPGQREVHVNVSDPHGAWTSGRITLSIREAPDETDPRPVENLTTADTTDVEQASRPAASPGPATVELPATIEGTANESRILHASASSPTAEVVNVTVALGGPLPVRGTEHVTALLPALPAGEYELAARAADVHGWGPWSNATFLVEPTPDARPLDASGQADASAAPIGPLAALVALVLAAWRWRS